MYLQRLLQIHMATLAALSVLLLSAGQDDSWIAPLVWMAIVLSMVVTDFTGWFRLSRNAVNVLGVIVGGVFIYQFLSHRNEGLVLALAKVLMFLQMIFLFLEKDERVFRQLAVLSLLEVVVAAGFNQGVWFGLLLVVWMLAGVSAMALLFLYGQWSRYKAGELPRPVVAPAGRWPLPSAAPRFVGNPAGSSRAGVVRELFGRLALLSFGTLVLAGVIFLTIPRLGRSAWRGVMVAPRQVVGFSDTVNLGQLGEILDNPQEVMRVQLLDPEDAKATPVTGTIYMRGAVLRHYERGQWQHHAAERDTGKPTAVRTTSRFVVRQIEQVVGAARNYGGVVLGAIGELFLAMEAPQATESDDPFTPPIQAEPGGTAPATSVARTEPGSARFTPLRPPLIQRITAEPMDRDDLFCIWPFTEPTRSIELDVNRQAGTLRRTGQSREQRFTYKLGTTAFLSGTQFYITPCEEPVYAEALLQMPDLPRVTALAREWIGTGVESTSGPLFRAELLQQKLGRSERFTYSLKGQDRDLSLDPIEDFVSEHPSGHCEYFASALAMMLRSQGIPARVVVGYKCDEWSEIGKYHQVRQSDAHAWVEAYLAPQDLPPGLPLEGDPERWAKGGWLRLDPTPAAAPDDSVLGKLQRVLQEIQSLWDNYVVEMDRQRQREAIYQPLVRAVQGLLKNLSDPEWWRGILARIRDAFRLSHWNSAGAWLLAVALPLALVLAVLAAISWALWRLGRRLWRRLAAHAGAVAARRRIRVEFYRRFEVLLARRGLVRPAAQTPRAFARAAGVRLAESTGRKDLAMRTGEVVEAYYRVRFGREPLDAPQAQAVEETLQELATLAKSQHGR